MNRFLLFTVLIVAFIGCYHTPRSNATNESPAQTSGSSGLTLKRTSTSLATKLSAKKEIRLKAELELASITDVEVLRSLLIQAIDDLKQSRLSSRESYKIVKRWAEVDPEGLLDFFVNEHGDLSVRFSPDTSYSFDIFGNWATQDPEGAMKAVLRLPKGRHYAAAWKVITAVYKSDPSKAFAMMIENEVTLSRDIDAGGYPLSLYHLRDHKLPDISQQALSKLPAGALRDRFLASIGVEFRARGKHSESHDEAWSWWKQLPAEDQGAALRGLIAYDSKVPTQLRENIRTAVAALDHPTTSLSLIRATGKEWADEDRQGAIDFINGSLQGRQRHRALSLLDEKE